MHLVNVQPTFDKKIFNNPILPVSQPYINYRKEHATHSKSQNFN